MRIRIKFFPKFLLIVLLISVVPLIFLGVRLLKIGRNFAKQSLMERYTELSGNLAYKIDGHFQELSRRLRFVSSSQSLKEISEEAKIQMLKAILVASTDVETIAFLDRVGNEITQFYNPKLIRSPYSEDRKDNPEFISARSGIPAIGCLYWRNDNPVVNVAYPFGEEVLFLTVRLDEILKEIQTAKTGKTGIAFVVDENGFLILHPDRELAMQRMDFSRHHLVEYLLATGSVGMADFVKEDEKMVGSYAPISTMGWGVIVQQSFKEAYASLFLMRKSAILLILSVVFLSFLITMVFTGAITKPIIALINASRKIAEGDFNQKIEVKTGDELEDLANTFNSMNMRLKVYNEMQIDKIIAERTKTKAIIFSVQEGLILTDYEGKILLLNDAAQRMLSLPGMPEEGESIFNYFEDEKNFLSDFFKEVIAGKGGNIVKEFNLSRGEYKKYIKTSTATVTTGKKEEIGIVSVFRDITLEKELDEIKDTFIHSITHDLRNPLTSMMGFMDMISMKKAGPLTEKQEKYLGVMKQESTRLLSMINDILDVAKLESGRMELNIAGCDINEVIESSIQSMAGTAMKKGIELQKEVKEAVEIDIDARLIQRVLINLMGNSLNYTPSGGKITVSSEDLKDKMRVCVADTGVGMPPEYCEKIFEKFSQIKGQSKGGTGLGLTVSKEIVEAHGGRIWAESEVGKGSRFYFEISKSKDN